MSKITNFKDMKVQYPNRYTVTETSGTKVDKTIDFNPGTIFEQGTPERAEYFNEIQKNSIYEVKGTRVVEGQNEIYDIVIDGSDTFAFDNLKLLLSVNETNVKQGSVLRFNGNLFSLKNSVEVITENYLNSNEKYFINLDFNKKTAEIVGVSYLENLNLLKGKMNIENTIEDLKNSKKYKVGDIVEVLGYYTKGDGGGHARQKKPTGYNGADAVIGADGSIWGIVHSGEVNVSWFGAKGDGVTDDTISIRKAIKSSYLYAEQVGWRRGVTIKFSNKTYICSTIIDGQLGIPAGRFTFQGTGQFSTIIKFTGTLINNRGVFGFSDFKDMQFIGDSETGKFMEMVSGVDGVGANAQGFNFIRCSYQKMKTIISTYGGTMCSEVRFYQCRLSEFDSNSILFDINNSQGVNWGFFGVDIEVFSGICFNLKSGWGCGFYNGSIIPYGDGIVVNVPIDANDNLFGESNSPDLVIYSTRFELRGNSKFLNKLNRFAKVNIVANGCGMGGYNQPEYSSSHKTVSIVGNGELVFNNCYNMQKWRIENSQIVSSPQQPNIVLNKCDVKIAEFLSNSKLSGADYNNYAYPLIDYDGTIFCGNANMNKKSYNKLNLINSVTVNGGNVTNNIYNKNICGESGFIIPITKITLSNFGRSGYGNPKLNFNIYNEDKSITLVSDSINIEDSKTMEFEVCKSVKGLVIEMSTSSEFNNITIPISIEVM